VRHKGGESRGGEASLPFRNRIFVKGIALPRPAVNLKPTGEATQRDTAGRAAIEQARGADTGKGRPSAGDTLSATGKKQKAGKRLDACRPWKKKRGL